MDCLSHIGQRVVAVCMKKEMNPEAPFKLLVGKGRDKERYSELLITEQKNEAIPIFVKVHSNEWEFCGHFRVASFSKELNVITKHERMARRYDVYMIIHFDEV